MNPASRAPFGVLFFVFLLAGCPESTIEPASCRSSRECSAAGLVCDVVTETCVECVEDVDCLAADRVCRANRCQAIVPCVSSRECPGRVCDPALGFCVECVTSLDCPDDLVCSDSTCVRDVVDAGPGELDAGPIGVDAGTDAGAPPPCTDELDLLFMIDNSNSMAEEQASLTSELPRLVRVLASGDRNGDGAADFTPIRSLHVGVTTSDMGTGGFAVPTCGSGTFGNALGDDGVLITRGRTELTGCGATYPAIFEFQADAAGADPDAFANDVACVATTGTGGCGFEQQLDAVLKALSPSAPQEWTVAGYSPPIFHAGTRGHAVGRNAGFVRPGSILATLLVTDEEDCSVTNPGLFDPDSATFGGTDLNLRCFSFPSELHPVERYVGGASGTSGLLGLRRHPAHLIFGAIVGVPIETVTDASGNPLAEPDYAVILGHPQMQESIDPAIPTRLRPSCNVPGRGLAFPPRRIVSVAEALDRAGANVMLQSICQESFSGPIDALIDDVAAASATCR